MKTKPNNTNGLAWLTRAALAVLAATTLMGCQLFGYGDDGDVDTREGPVAIDPTTQVVVVIRRAEVPRDVPTERAWALTNERVVLPIQRGGWLGNGLRLGVLERDQVDAFGQAMPAPLASTQTVIGKSKHPVPIIETPLLSPNLQFEVDLTQPPRPIALEPVIGGKNSRLRLLAQLETKDTGEHTLVLTPQHYVPSPFDLIPRDPWLKELDGRVFEELRLRIPLKPEQIVVVGLYWPWPEALRLEAERAMRESIADPGSQDTTPTQAPTAKDQNDKTGNTEPPQPNAPLPPADPTDPAAPPHHLRDLPPIALQPGITDTPTKDVQERIAPPLPLHLGSTLLTGQTLRGVPTQTVLLITIQAVGG